jgi:hypothetical protein
MKYLIKETNTREIELTFPFYTSDKTVYYYIVSPNKTIAVYTSTDCIETFSTIIGAEYPECRRDKFIANFNLVMHNIIDSL